MSTHKITPRMVVLAAPMMATPVCSISGEPTSESPRRLAIGYRLLWNEGWVEPPGMQTVVGQDGHMFRVDAADLTSRRLTWEAHVARSAS